MTTSGVGAISGMSGAALRERPSGASLARGAPSLHAPARSTDSMEMTMHVARRRRSLPLLIALSLAGSVGCAGGTPVTTKPAVVPGAPPRAAGLDALLLATQLARQGRTANSPLVLLAAAQLLVDAPPRPLDAPVIDAPGLDEAARRMAGGAPRISAATRLEVNSLLAAAEQAGRDNPNVVALAGQLRQRAQAGARGAAGGARYYEDLIDPSGRHTFSVSFEGGRPAQFGVIGGGESDLDCFVYDAAGKMIASDKEMTDVCLLTWQPATTATYTLVVRNQSSSKGNYYVAGTN